MYGVRRAFIQHVKKSGTAYAPALAPLVFFFLAHFVSLLAFVFLKAGALRQEQLVHKTVVTWAVFGFLPLLLSCGPTGGGEFGSSVSALVRDEA